jgi:hypothetical protein
LGALARRELFGTRQVRTDVQVLYESRGKECERAVQLTPLFDTGPRLLALALDTFLYASIIEPGVDGEWGNRYATHVSRLIAGSLG